MDLEIKRDLAKYKIVIDGQVYELAKPKVGQLLKYRSQNPEETVEKTIELLEFLGLPRDVIESLSQEELVKVMNVVHAVKKS